MRPPRLGRHALTADAPEPSLKTTTGGQVRVEVVTTSGRGATLEFRVRRDSVELWHREHLGADFDRQLLTNWLREPGAPLVVDEATLSVDWVVDSRGRVAVTLPDVDAWTLSPADLDALYRRVVTDQKENNVD